MDGGLGLSELGMVTACPGVGKTNTLIHFGVSATFVNIRTLFVTLELKSAKINRRNIAMTAGINGSVIKSVYSAWPAEARRRYDMLRDAPFGPLNLFTVADYAGEYFTLDKLDDEIERWREETAADFGDDAAEDCCLVCVDWADLAHIAGERSNAAEHERTTAVLKELKAIANRKNVGIWTATQGTREADGREVVRMSHVAYGYHKNDALDIGIGLGIVNEGGAQQQQQNTRNMITSRHLALTINKNRDGSTGTFNVYQGPTLRLYDDMRAYQEHARIMNNAKTADLVWSTGSELGTNYERSIT
jgi:replicative DNA helicase